MVNSVRPDHEEDVLTARRTAAQFGGGEPTMPSMVREFVRKYGWRAYALPILVVVTIAALMTARSSPAARTTAGTGGSPAAGASAPPLADANIALKSDQPGTGAANDVLALGALPSGPPVTMTGTGTFRVLKGTSSVVGSGTVHRYDIEVENGVTGVDTAQFAAMVQSVLSDKRSWSGHGVAVQRVSSGPIDFHVSLTSRMTVRDYCGYTIHVETSCYATAYTMPGLDANRVVINVARWMRGAAPYVGDLAAYRTYMINHEDGHALGHQHAHDCLAGGLAPVMMQQTIGLKSASTGKQCQANPWPYPPGATDAPGVEGPDNPQNNEYNLQD